MLTHSEQPNSRLCHHRLHYMCLILLEICLRIPSPQILAIQVGLNNQFSVQLLAAFSAQPVDQSTAFKKSEKHLHGFQENHAHRLNNSLLPSFHWL